MEFTLLNPYTNTLLRFPIAPSELQVQIGPKTLSFSPIMMGDVEVPKGRQPMRFTMSGFFPGPGHSLPRASSAQPNDIVSQLRQWSDNAYLQPLRFIVTNTPWNLLVFISQFEATHRGGLGDVWYTLSLTEWRPVRIQEVGSATTVQVAAKREDTKPKSQTYTVKSGDSLWKIAQRFYGNGSQWRKIYEANKGKIKNPDLIYPGQQLIIPA